MRVCPQCGHEVHETTRFCPNCGQRLAAQESAATPMPSLGVTIPRPEPASRADAPALADVPPPATPAVSPARLADMAGRTVGHYRVERRLGEGGEGSVYLAHDADEPARAVAIKLYPLMRWADEVRDLGVVSAQLEVRILSQLDHPRIVKVVDSGVDRDAGVSYIVFSFVDGQTLARHIADGPMSFEEIGRCVSQLADAVDYLHARGIVHRDIKPANVLLDAHGDIAIFDFGIALDRGDTAQPRAGGAGGDEPAAVRDMAITAAGAVMGTPYYMAPEQVRGGHLGPYTDIYALGMVAYQMVTGRVAFEGESMLQVALQIAQRDPPPPSRARPDLPAAAEFAILKCLSKVPANRYPSAGAFAAALVGGLRGEWVEGASPEATSDAQVPVGPDRLLLDVFISYSRADSAFVDRLEADLQDNGYRTWVDRHKLVGGRAWKADIEMSIERAQVVLVVLSSTAVASKYVRMEYARAIRLRRAIIPILASPPAIPAELAHLQVVDFARGYPAAFKDLLTALS